MAAMKKTKQAVKKTKQAMNEDHLQPKVLSILKVMAISVAIVALSCDAALADMKVAKKKGKPKNTTAKQARATFIKLDKNNDQMLTFEEFSTGMAPNAQTRKVFDGMQSELDQESQAYKETTFLEFRDKYPQYAALKGALKPEPPKAKIPTNKQKPNKNKQNKKKMMMNQ